MFHGIAKQIVNSLASMGAILGISERRHGARLSSTYYKPPQSAESRKFMLDRAVDKRNRKGAIRRHLAERGIMQFSDAHIAKFGRDKGVAHYTVPPEIVDNGDYLYTKIYRPEKVRVTFGKPHTGRNVDMLTTNTLPVDVKEIGQADFKEAVDKLEAMAADKPELPPGCHYGPLMGEITITDPDLWQRLIAYPHVRLKNKRKQTIYATDAYMVS